MSCRGLRCIICLIVLAVLISGCSVNPSISSPSELSLNAWQSRVQRLAVLPSWIFRGRVLVKTDTDGWNGNIVWQQKPDGYLIDFMTPVGQKVMQIKGGPGKAELSVADGKAYQARDAESLLYSQLGWGLPVDTLVSWITGIPASEGWHSINLDDSGRIINLEQSDWSIHYKRYNNVNGLDLPDKVFLDKGEVNIRLVISDWVL